MPPYNSCFLSLVQRRVPMEQPSANESDELKEQRKQAVLARREEMRKRAFENAGEDPNATPQAPPAQGLC